MMTSNAGNKVWYAWRGDGGFYSAKNTIYPGPTKKEGYRCVFACSFNKVFSF